MEELRPISEIETRYTRQHIVQLCQDERIRAEKRSIGGVELWFASQADVTAYEAEVDAVGDAKHGWRYPELVPEPVA